MFGDNLVEYAVQMPNQRYLTRLRHKNVVLTQKVYGSYMFTKNMEDIKEIILDDVKSRFGLSSINESNTLLSKILKYGTNKNEYLYILTVVNGCFLCEMVNRIVSDYTYLLGKNTLRKLLAINKAMVTFPKLLPVEQETAIETLQYNRI